MKTVTQTLANVQANVERGAFRWRGGKSQGHSWNSRRMKYLTPELALVLMEEARYDLIEIKTIPEKTEKVPEKSTTRRWWLF